jgi:hypothetical protein
MNKLWVYGCSFSEPFQLEYNDNGTVSGPLFEEDGRTRILRADYWGTYLAKKLGMTCVTRAYAGQGLNQIIFQIEQDVQSWNKEDVIIISPSFLDRVTLMELHHFDLAEHPTTFSLYKSNNEIFMYNRHRWKLNVSNYQHLGYRVYTWLVNDIDETYVKNIITAPNGSVNWKNWMDQHYEYWFSLPGEYNSYTKSVLPLGDWHFNAQGHEAVANRMHQYIVLNK